MLKCGAILGMFFGLAGMSFGLSPALAASAKPPPHPAVAIHGAGPITSSDTPGTWITGPSGETITKVTSNYHVVNGGTHEVATSVVEAMGVNLPQEPAGVSCYTFDTSETLTDITIRLITWKMWDRFCENDVIVLTHSTWTSYTISGYGDFEFWGYTGQNFHEFNCWYANSHACSGNTEQLGARFSERWVPFLTWDPRAEQHERYTGYYT